MKLKFEEPSFQYMLDAILEFQKEDQGDFFKESLFHFYPQFDKEKMLLMQQEEKELYLKAVFEKIYAENQSALQEKVKVYQEYWDKNEAVIVKAFESIFHMDLSNRFNPMKAYISLNPICPRYLDTNTFDVFYLSSEKGALGISLHEITHFIWFQKWNEQYHDNWEEYESPHLKWLVSEMVVESILSHKNLRPLNPYAGNSVYEYFYKIKIEETPLLEVLDKLYRENSITLFMEKAYTLCKKNEALIRSFVY